MTVIELRELLDSLPADLPVFTAYDSMVCIDDVENILLVKDGEEKGVFLCAPSADHLYALETKGRFKDGVLIR